MVQIDIQKEMEYGQQSRQLRRVLAVVQIGTANEAFHANDFNLMSIEHMTVQPRSAEGTPSNAAGTWFNMHLLAPGSFANQGNLASIKAFGYRLLAGTIDGTTVLAGTSVWYAAVEGW